MATLTSYRLIVRRRRSSKHVASRTLSLSFLKQRQEKTTRVPQSIVDEKQRAGRRCRIVVTEQERFAEISAPEGVGGERGEMLGRSRRGSVGYGVKEDMCLPYSWNSFVLATGDKLLNVFHSSDLTHVIID